MFLLATVIVAFLFLHTELCGWWGKIIARRKDFGRGRRRRKSHDASVAMQYNVPASSSRFCIANKQ